jgi:hypothetical protein
MITSFSGLVNQQLVPRPEIQSTRWVFQQRLVIQPKHSLVEALHPHGVIFRSISLKGFERRGAAFGPG